VSAARRRGECRDLDGDGDVDGATSFSSSCPAHLLPSQPVPRHERRSQGVLQCGVEWCGSIGMEDWSVWRVAGVAAIAWLAWHVWRVHQFMARYYARPDDATSRAASNERGDDGTSSRSGSSYVLSNGTLSW